MTNALHIVSQPRKKQAQDKYPHETGGFLGGHDNKILGVLPVVNKQVKDQATKFSLNDEDVERAYHFLVKHKLEFLGVYHTHPKGAAVPSAQDLSHNQKYLFIISLKDRYNPEFYAWRVENNKACQEDIKVISDAGTTVIDIITTSPKLSDNVKKEEMDSLAQQIDAWIAGQKPEYKKQKALEWDPSTFNTTA